MRVWKGGPVPPGADAITLGSLVIVRRRAADDPRLMRHEEEHVRQWRELGVVGFLRRYLGAYLRIPLEAEAEWVARRSVRR